MKDGLPKEFFNLDIHRLVITAIDQNNTVTSPVAVMNRNNNAISPVQLVSNLHTFPMMRFASPPLFPHPFTPPPAPLIIMQILAMDKKKINYKL